MKTTIRHLFWATIYALAVTSPIWAQTLLAHADPDGTNQAAIVYAASHTNMVCAQLDAEPTIDGIGDTGLYITQHSHLDFEQAGIVIGLSVRTACPQHQGLLNRFLAKYATSPGAGWVMA
jgi:hypothetical protein